MAYLDSVDKIVKSYLAAVTREPFTYKGVVYQPKTLKVSPHFFNEYQCVLGCAGCCSHRFTLDYIGGEPIPDIPHTMRAVRINDQEVTIHTYDQQHAGESRFCDNVDLITGACKIHGAQPFTCDFETLRFSHFEDHVWLGTRPYGRGWVMMRIDGERGAKCVFSKQKTEEALADAVRRLERLQRWADAFGLRTCIPEILEWANTGIKNESLIIEV